MALAQRNPIPAQVALHDLLSLGLLLLAA